MRELLDDAAVGGRDDDDRDPREGRQADGQVRVLAQRLEGFFRAVGGGRQSVRAQADPGQEGDERQMVVRGLVLDRADYTTPAVNAASRRGPSV
jgi:hypothetical protein